MKKILDIIVPENGSDRTMASRRNNSGQYRKICPGIYTDNLADSIETVSRRNWIPLVGILCPNQVVSYRSALAGGLGKENVLFVAGKRYRTINLPGFFVQVVPGMGPLEGDMPLGDSLFMASRGRALLESLLPSSTGTIGVRKGLSLEEVSDILGRILSSGGSKELNRIRDQAKALARALSAGKEFAVLDSLCGAFLGTRVFDSPPKAVRNSRFAAMATDSRRGQQ